MQVENLINIKELDIQIPIIQIILNQVKSKFNTRLMEIEPEVAKYKEADKNLDNIEEMVDILEVIRAILDHYNVSYEEIEEKRIKKAKKRGAFKDKVFLEKVIQNGD